MKRCSKFTIIGISFTVIIFLGLFSSQTVACGGFKRREYWPGWFSWRQTSPERQNMNSSKIEEMYDFVEANGIDIHSALIIRNGYIVNEEYLNDSKRMEQKSYEWPEADPFIQLRDGRLHCLWSATKSVVSLLTGIAIEQGLFDLNTTFFEVFPDRWNSTLYGDHGPENLGDAKLDITVENLLLQNTGIEWDELGYWWDWYFTDFNLDYYLTRNMSYVPGSDDYDAWTYSSGNQEMLSVMIANKSGMTMADFARKYLFRPLKIRDSEWDWWEGASAWGTGDLAIKNHGGFGLFMTHRAMARIGLMCLNDGKWRSYLGWRQVVSKEWIEVSTSVQISKWFGGLNYGYLWWPYDNYYSAIGLAGQQIIVIPEDNIVVVFTADDDRSGSLIDFILDAVL
ncbi:MAG: serine hydrolase domain-containing protein [Promethearchaeota archaeon]